MKQGIVFDMDGILFDTERLSLISHHKTAEEMNLTNFDIDAIAADSVALNYTDTLALITKKYPGFPYEDFHKRLQVNFADIRKDDVPLKPGTMEILTYLNETGWIVGLASSSHLDSVMYNLKKKGMEHFFRVIIGGDMVEHSKPQPDIYLKACEKLGIDPKESYAVEDSFNGIRSAYAAGMKSIMIPDLLQPTDEILSMVYQKFDSLFAFMDYLKEQTEK